MLAICATVLGYLGFSEAVPGEGALDAGYRTVGLFVLETGLVDGRRKPWTLEVARFLAPAVLSYAAIRGLASVYREEVQAWRARSVLRRHAVVVGLGHDGAHLAQALDEARRAGPATDARPEARGAVAGVEINRTSKHVSGLLQRRIPVVYGDGTDPVTLRQAGIARAAHVIAVTEADSNNLGVLEACSRVSRSGTAQTLTVHVQVDDVRLWRALSADAIMVPGRGSMRIEPFNVPERIAEVLASVVIGMCRDRAVVRIACIGDGPVARRTLARLLRSSLPCRSPLLMGPEGCEHASALQREDPDLADVVRCTDVVAADPETTPPDVVVVAYADDAQGLSVARDVLEGASVSRVVLAVSTDRFERALVTAHAAPDRLTPVGAHSLALGAGLLEATSTDSIARARHELYVRAALERGERPADNPSLVPWEALPPLLKESNRRYADAVGEYVRDLGCRLVGIDAAPPAPPALDGAVIERLACAEHDRWMRDLERDGWKPTQTPGASKDPSAKRHPLLVPWDQLAEADREKDRDSIRGIPEVLAAAGFGLVHQEAV